MVVGTDATEARSSTDLRRRPDAGPRRYRVITFLSMDRNCCWLQLGWDDEGIAVPTLILGAICFKDRPNHRHDGRSYAVQSELVAKTAHLREKVHALKSFLSRVRRAPNVAVHVYCNRGKHRSVALAEQFYQLLAYHVREPWLNIDEVRLVHRSFDWHKHFHHGCHLCATGQGPRRGETKRALAAKYVLPLWDGCRI